MRILGVDYGDSRTGISLSDGTCTVASPYGVIDGNKGRKAVASEIAEICRKNDVGIIVIGYPLNMDGSSGERVKITEKFAKLLKEYILPETEIVFRDERLTTRAADLAMREMNVHQKQKGVSDVIAANMILQGYLDSIKNDMSYKGEKS